MVLRCFVRPLTIMAHGVQASPTLNDRTGPRERN